MHAQNRPRQGGPRSQHWRPQLIGRHHSFAIFLGRPSEIYYLFVKDWYVVRTYVRTFVPWSLEDRCPMPMESLLSRFTHRNAFFGSTARHAAANVKVSKRTVLSRKPVDNIYIYMYVVNLHREDTRAQKPVVKKKVS